MVQEAAGTGLLQAGPHPRAVRAPGGARLSGNPAVFRRSVRRAIAAIDNEITEIGAATELPGGKNSVRQRVKAALITWISKPVTIEWP
jgi:hypothetical protein